MCETCKCNGRVGGCNEPTDLCKCSWCSCLSSYEDRKHEIDRVSQFKKKARDDSHFRQLIFNRAAKCGPEKRERFITTLKRIGRQDLAAFIESCFKEREVK